MKAQVSLLAASLWMAVVPWAAAAGDVDSVAAAGADSAAHRDRRTGIAIEQAVLRRGRIVIVGTTLLPGQRIVLDFPRVSVRASRKRGGAARFRISVPAPPGDCSAVLSVGGRRSAPTTIAACPAALNARGEWRRDRGYAAGDLVTRDGSTWLAQRRSKGIVPGANTNAWRIFAARGATGPRGRTGAAGPAGAAGMDGATGAQGPAGMDGVNGATGAPGPAGPAGDEGPAGPTGADGKGFRFRGPYAAAATDYLPGDVVVTEGTAFVATTADPPGPPDLPGAGFDLLAARGMDGEQGEPGPQGGQGERGETGEVGAQGLQGVPGVKGDTGEIGPQGLQGAQGVKGDTGDVGPQGPRGVSGDAGPMGPSGTVATVMLYGSPASVPPTVAGGVFRMVSPAATVVVTASQRITGMIAAPAYGTGAPPIFSYAMCWRPEGSLAEPTLILPPGGTSPQLATSYGSFRGSHAAAGSTVPGVNGSIEVGLCVRDYSATSGYGTIVVDVQTGFLAVSQN